MIRNLGRYIAVLFGVFVMTGCNSIVTPTVVVVSPLAPGTTVMVGATPADEANPALADVAGNSEEETVPDTDMSDRLTTQATENLAGRLSIPVDQIDVLEVRPVTWPDASLGCAKPSMVYVQVPQDGLLIRLGAGERMYFYHSGADGEPFLCERTTQTVPKVTPKTDEFVPPPDSEID